MNKYKALIAIEMHCEISNTKSKVFSDSANSYCVDPNVNVSPIDMAFPGVLPILNKEAVRKALKASMILNCKQPEYMYFERKNYYYPDLPKGYQITQETKPAPVGIYGSLDYEVNGEVKTAIIDNIHLEEDSAAMQHFADVSTIDYNRCGVPLLELVTTPCFHNADEVVAFLETMRQNYRYAKISEADSKKGQIRCDVNVSIMDYDLDESNKDNWGVKVETKNVNSFSAVRDVINYEIKRQTDAKLNGTYEVDVQQETRRYDEESQKTIRMRGKADAADYKFFIEPNIPKFRITEKFLEDVRSEIPVLARDRKNKYISEYNLSEVDANTLVREIEIADYFEELIKLGVDAKVASNWMTTLILGSINKLEISIDDFFIRPNTVYKLIKMIDDGKINKNQAKNVLYRAVDENKDPLLIIKDENMQQLDNMDELEGIVDRIINEHPNEVEQYKNGRDNVVNFMLGLVMKETKGKANPAKTMQMFKDKLSK